MSLKKKLIGDKAFYSMVFAVAIPIMIQNGITNFVGLLDNIMVGQVGTEPMSGVSIVNQLLQVYYICIFGGLSGAGIFGAQFFGSGDMEGVRHAYRFKLYVCVLLTAAGFLVFTLLDTPLINLYLHDTGDGVADVTRVLGYGRSYLKIMLWGLPPFALSQAYATSLRETGETKLPMIAGITAVFVNLIFNYILIFGHFGAPKMGTEGAAIATVLSRYVELGIMVWVVHRHTDHFTFAQGLYRTIKIPLSLAGRIFKMGAPLQLNEILWSVSMAAITQCYSMRGVTAVAALNISMTVSNLFNVVFYSMGSAVSIIVGQKLGAGDIEDAKDTDVKLIFFSAVLCVGMGLLMIASAPFIPRIYNTASEVRSLATKLIIVAAACMPLYSTNNACYFTIRSGGKTWITFAFDSMYQCLISYPFAFVLAHFTGINVVTMFLMVQLIDIFKLIAGLILVHKGTWATNLVA